MVGGWGGGGAYSGQQLMLHGRDDLDALAPQVCVGVLGRGDGKAWQMWQCAVPFCMLGIGQDRSCAARINAVVH